MPREYFPHDYTGVSRIGFRDASDVLVAVVDCGMDLTLSSLKDNLWKGPVNCLEELGIPGSSEVHHKYIHGIDFTEPDSPTANPVPFSGEPTHGTNVASIIGARSTRRSRFAGVAHSLQLMPLKVFPTRIEHYAASVSRAVTFAVHHGAHIINCSFFLYTDDEALSRAFQYACDRGVLVVAASGNQDADLAVQTGLPASLDYPNILTVGSIGKERPDHLSDKSNFGEKVHLAAPGGDFEILTGLEAGNLILGISTSYAAAYVSGASALVWRHLASKGCSKKQMVACVKEALLEHARCVSPSIATGVDAQRIKRWGDKNRVLDLRFLAGAGA